MTFKHDAIATFEQIFNANRNNIRTFEGCAFLELYQDQNQANVFFTYSHWEHGDFLEKYRTSDLFKGVWAQTKVLFSDKPEAWSLTKK